MIPFTFRPMAAWPYEEQPARPATYKVSYDRMLKDLSDELELLGAVDVVIGLVTRGGAADLRLDGMLRARTQVDHVGVELSFTALGIGVPVGKGERFIYHTDIHKGGWREHYGHLPWHDNLRAISLGLESLRAVERYGITQTGQQYAGFAQLPAGASESAERGRTILNDRFGGDITQALWDLAPDRGGNEQDFKDVLAYRQSLRS